MFNLATKFKFSIKNLAVPYQLALRQDSIIPSLPKLTPTPFQRPFSGPIYMPIFDFKTGEYSGTLTELDQKVFNQLIRRDIVHRVVIYRQMLYKQILQGGKRMKDMNSSGKKLRPQKQSGRARMGMKNRVGQKGGMKAHSRVPRQLRIKLPKKIRLLGLKITLTAALYDGRIRIIENESVENGKTKELVQQLQNFVDNSNKPVESILIIRSMKDDQNFLRASSNIQFLEETSCDRLNVLKLLKNKWILITKEGLEQLVGLLHERSYALAQPLIRRKKLERPMERLRQEVRSILFIINYQIRNQFVEKEEKVVYDPNKPLDLNFKVLQDYLNDFEKLKKSGELEKYIESMPKTKRDNRVNTL